jgi:SAM-dependent methyltransferase
MSDIGGYEKVAHLYDLFDKKNNIEFFYQYARNAGEILDIGAGTGRIAVPIARRGIKVYCVEPSPAMRREFLKKLSWESDIKDNITLVEGDATSFDFGRTFPAAFLSGCFEHFINDDERLLSLLNINKHLILKGILVFDVLIGQMKDSPLSPAGVIKKGDIEYKRLVGGKVLPDKKKSVILIYEEYKNGKLINRIEEHSTVGIIDRQGIHSTLSESGFEVNKEFSNYDYTPYKEGDETLIIEAIKVR